ncbi:MAG: tRNA lysidine(34) synthetase TilS [Flavobacteriaceae bacterium]|nr:tRNA lysidine(34) synthetase TilS [Flavobacteriaceae bacterium]
MDIQSIKHNYASQFKGKLLLAHSGGVDSCVLADYLLKQNCNLSVAHANFQLRGEQSDHAQVLVSDWCKTHGISFYTIRFDTISFQSSSKMGLQEGARELRYKWFSYLVDIFNFDYLLTAHHLNDQLETFLIHALRGTGIKGLTGIKEYGKILRPLGDIPKRNIIKYAIENQIRWSEDKTNLNLTFLRNRIRHQIIAPLEHLDSSITEKFKTTIENIQQTNSFVDTTLNEIKNKISVQKSDGIYFSLRDLNNLNHMEFCLYGLFHQYQFKVSEILKLMSSSNGKYIENSQFRLIRSRNHLIVTDKKDSHIENEDYQLFVDFNMNHGRVEFPIELRWETLNSFPKNRQKAHISFFDKNKLLGDLKIGRMRRGDYFYPIGMKGKKLISKYYRDLKLTPLEKQNQWILYCDEKIAWVVNRRCDRRFAADLSTREIISFKLLG